MAALSSLVRSLLGAYASLLFSRSLLAGAVLLVATALSPAAFAHGLLAMATAAATARLLGLGEGAIAEGPYGYNALLVGLGVGHAYAAGPASAAFAAGSAVVCTLLAAALSSLLTRTASLPPLSLPFVLTAWLAVGAVQLAGLEPSSAAAAVDPSPFALDVPEPYAAGLRAIGSLIYAPDEASGLLVLSAIALHSRIAAALTALAVAAGITLGDSLAPGLGAALALNGMLVSVAVGGVWFVPSPSSFALAAASWVLSASLVVGLGGPLARLGLPGLIVPFNLALGLVLFATRQRAYDRSPKSVDFTPGSPEENLAYYQSRLARFDALYAIDFRLPFRGAWTCTQGEDGPLTHQGAWRHAFDFEVQGEDGRLFHGEGGSLDDHHCFRLPVLASADGVVVKVVNEVPDNAVGGLDLKRNWGNVVVVQHAPGLFSLVAHLAQGSVRVREGQPVLRGEVLGSCGSSGRSPRPHLHFQLQASAELGAPTLPCRFADAVMVDSPWNHRAERSLAPAEGSLVRPLEPDAELAACLSLEPGAELSFRVGGKVERLEYVVDLLGNRVLRSRDREASLFFARGESGFVSLDALGSSRSVVHLLRAALARVPFDGARGLGWGDHVPRRWSGGPLARALADLWSPFSPSPGVAMRYWFEREGRSLSVVGESLARDWRGRPRVKTRAELSADEGVKTVEVEAGGRRVRAELVVEGEGPSGENLAPGAAGENLAPGAAGENLSPGPSPSSWGGESFQREAPVPTPL